MNREHNSRHDDTLHRRERKIVDFVMYVAAPLAMVAWIIWALDALRSAG